MKLNAKEFKRFKELTAKMKAGKASSSEEQEFNELQAKKNERGSNDIKWWDNYPTLTADVTNIPFNFIQGNSLDTRNPNNQALSLYFGSVARLGYIPSIGVSRTGSDPFNAQMRQLWLDMHRKYRGIGAYQRSDLGIMILSVLGVFSTLAKFERIYSVLNTYKIQNRNVPSTLFEALQIDTSIGASLADFRYGLNYRIAKLQQLCLPKGIAALEAELTNNLFIFKDSEDPRSALFLFDPDVFAIYDPLTLSAGGCVKYQTYASVQTGTTPMGSSAFTMLDIFNILDTQMSALLSDDDVAKMCSDLVAAYGPENVNTLVPVPENMVNEPIFDYERKLQFHNATINGDVSSIYAQGVTDTAANNFLAANCPIVIYQYNDIIWNALSVCPAYIATDLYEDDAGTVVRSIGADPYAYFGTCVKAKSVVFDTWVDKPSTMEVMCGSRLSTVAGFIRTTYTSKYYQPLESFGTVVPTHLHVYTRATTGGITYHKFSANQVKSAEISSNVEAYCNMQQLDWHPLIYVDVGSGREAIVGDVDNCTLVTDDMLGRIHDVALYSAYKIPNVAYIS